MQCSAGRQVVQVMQADKKEEEEKKKNKNKTQTKRLVRKKLLVVGMDFIQYHSNFVYCKTHSSSCM